MKKEINEDMFYDPNPIIDLAYKLKCDCGMVGGKGNGKTYGIIKRYLKDFIKNNRYLCYCRRYAESIMPTAIEHLLLPQKQNLINLTNGEFNDFQYFRKKFYLIRRGDDGKIEEKKSEPFIICRALNSITSTTGTDEGECAAVFYDEVLSRAEKELDDEYTALMTLHSNCWRNRFYYHCPIILVGNTFSRNNRLLNEEFGVPLYDLKQGEIIVVKNSQSVPKIAFEHCVPAAVMKISGENYYDKYENNKIKMIYTGEWTVGNYPRIERRYITAAEKAFNFLIIAPNNTKLTAYILIYKSYVFLYVKKFDNKKDKDVDVILKNCITPLQDNIFNYLDKQHRFFNIFAKLILTKNTFFETNQIGEFFRDFLRNFNGAETLGNMYK